MKRTSKKRTSKKRTSKKQLSWVLILSMVLSMFTGMTVTEGAVEPGTFTDLNTLIASATNGDTITLNKDYIFDSKVDGASRPAYPDNWVIFIDTDKVVTIDLNGHTINRNATNESPSQWGGVIYVNDKGKLTLRDSSADKSGLITGGNVSSNGGGVIIKNGATFTMEGGTISGNKSTQSGGGVFCDVSTTFKMSGGTITNNTAVKGGGGVMNTSGSIYLGGTAVIWNNHLTATPDKQNNFEQSTNYRTKYITVGTGANGASVPSSDMKIGVTYSWVTTSQAITVADANISQYVECFSSDKPEFKVGEKTTTDNKLYLYKPGTNGFAAPLEATGLEYGTEPGDTPADWNSYFTVTQTAGEGIPTVTRITLPSNTDAQTLAATYFNESTGKLNNNDDLVYFDLELSSGTATIKDITYTAAGYGSVWSPLTISITFTYSGDGKVYVLTYQAHKITYYEPTTKGATDAWTKIAVEVFAPGANTAMTQTKPAAAKTPDGKQLSGWSTTADGNTLFTFGSQLTGDIDLYPIWVDHTHTWGYTVVDNVITATCTENSDHTATLTLTADDANYSGSAYIGASHNNGTGEVDFAGTTGAIISNIEYFLSDGSTKTTAENSGAASEGAAPVKVGDYVAKLTVTQEGAMGSPTTAVKSFKINKAEPATAQLTYTAPSGLVYDGNAKTATVVAKFGVTGLGSIIVKYYKNGVLVTDTKLPGTYTVKVDIAEGDNYTAKNDINVGSFTISKGSAPSSVKDISGVNITASVGSTVDVTLPTDTTFGTVSSTNTKVSGTITDNTLTLTVNETITGTDNFTVTIPVTGSNLYEEYEITVTVTPVQKTVVAINGVAAPETMPTYSGTPINMLIFGTPSVEENAVPVNELVYTYVGTDSTSYGPSTTAPTNVGSYKVTITVPDSNPTHTGKKEILFTIGKRSITAPAASLFTTKNETIVNKKDGTISGILTTMEYKIGDGEWLNGTGNDVTGFSGETIKVRYKGTETDLPSAEYSYTFTPSTKKYKVKIGTEQQEIAYNGKITRPATPEDNAPYGDGVFLGWETNGSLWNFDTPVISDMILTARVGVTLTGNITASGYASIDSVKLVDANGNNYTGTAIGSEPIYNYSVTAPKGTYNLIIKGIKDGSQRTVTKLVVLPGADGNVVMPEGKISSEVDASSSRDFAQHVLVGGLNEIDAADVGAASTDVVEIKLKVDDTITPASAESTAIEAKAGSKTLNYVDFSLYKNVNSGSDVNIGDSNTKLLKIIIPFDTNGKYHVTIYRYHGSEAQEITAIANANGEKIEIATDKKTVTLYAMKFSTYALGYDTTAPTPSPTPGGGGSSSGGGSVAPAKNPVTVPNVPNGKVTSDKSTASKNEKVTITVIPDDGYNVDKVSVTDKNGKPVELTDLGSGKYSFIMPDSKVTVDVTYKQTEIKEPEPEKTPEQEKQEEINTLALNAGLKVSQTGKGINVKWGKVTGADGYFVYASYCGQPLKKIKTIKNVNTISYKITKLDGKALNLKKNYKVCIAAYKIENGKKVTIAKTIAGHVVGLKNTNNTNAKGIKLAKSKYTLAVGKTATIKAATILVDPAKAQLGDEHTKEFRYATSDKSVATVSKAGKITAKKAGKCTIYVYARNGYAKKITVTVK